MNHALIAAAVIPAVIAWMLIAWLRRAPWAERLADHPNERSLHDRPVRRIGGLGVMVGVLPVAWTFADASLATILACAAALALVSFADDVQSLPIEVRLPAHFAAATIAILAIASPAPGHAGLTAVEAAVAIVGLVWMANLFNFMDGSDGLAGGMALIGFASLAIGACFADDAPSMLVNIALASAAAGFLLHNFPPARAFLGDAGSVPLGFLAAALGLHGVIAGSWPPWFPILVFSPFIADATFTLARRVATGERFWRAHRSHYYQRLVLAGWTRRRLARVSYVLMALAAASALLALRSGPMVQFGIIVGWLTVFPLLFIVIGRFAPVRS